ncbi:alpha/beta hydrolase family protein [Mycobacterium sp. NPDC003449]
MTRPSGPRRWHDQRWIIDSVLRTDGLEWDQPRVAYTLRPMGVDATPDFAVATSRISKFADIVPVFTERAERRHALAVAAEKAIRPESAREHYFHAALLYATAEWPIWENTQELLDLDDRKNDCFSAYARLADHLVERVEIDLNGSYIPAWFHLPPGYAGGPVPTVLFCGGMDAPKELNVNLYGDKLLQRGFAVLSFDGPGQGEAPIRGLYFTPTAWVDAGAAVMEWCRQRDEVDNDRIVGLGLSFGSYWMSQIAASQPDLKGAAVGLVCHEPGCHTIFECASPSFKARYMWMSGLENDEAAFDEMVTRIDLGPVMGQMTVPWLVVAGDEDELSPIQHSYDLLARCASPSAMLVYQQGRHALSLPTPSVASGPNWLTYSADWLLDRVDGKAVDECVEYVLPTGDIQRRPHPKEMLA